MRLSHNSGEDKPPLNLSNDFVHHSGSSQPTEQLSSTSSPTQGPGFQPPNAPTVTSGDAKADHCTASCPLQIGTVGNEVANDGVADVQSFSHPSVISTEKRAFNGDDPGPTPEHTTPDTCCTTDDNTYPEGGLAAWLVVLGSFSGMVASFGILNTVGTFQAYLSTHQLAQHSPASIGWVFSIFTFLVFFCGVQIGPIFDANGPRWLVAAGSVFMFAGMMGVAESTKLWHFFISFSLVSGIGSSLIFTPAVGAIAHWFMKRRAAATGIATTGGSIGGIIFPLMLQRLFPLVGFKWATRILAFMFLFLLSIANLLIRTRLTPRDRTKRGEKGVVAPNIKKDIWPDVRIFKHAVFALTTAGVFFIEWALFIPVSYITSYALDHGVNSAFSYQILAILNAGSFFGRWAPGFIADRFGRFNTMIATVALCLLSVLCLWLTCLPESGAGGMAQFIIFALIFGFASGSNISLTPVCVGQLCGTEVFGRWYASLYTVVSFGCLTGIPIAGELIAADGGSYTALILFVGACYGLGLICFVWARVMTVGWGLTKIY